MKKKILLGLALSVACIKLNAKTLEVFNETSIAIDFSSSSYCISPVPSKFRLKGGESKKIDINIDKNNNCPIGQTYPVYNLYAQAVDHNFNASFSYLTQITDYDLGESSEFKCRKLKDANYFCYYVNPNAYHPAAKLEYDHKFIYIR